MGRDLFSSQDGWIREWAGYGLVNGQAITKATSLSKVGKQDNRLPRCDGLVSHTSRLVLLHYCLCLKGNDWPPSASGIMIGYSSLRTSAS